MKTLEYTPLYNLLAPFCLSVIILALMVISGMNLNAQSEVVWEKELPHPSTIRDCIILPSEDFVVNTNGYLLQLRDISTGEIIREKDFGTPIRKMINIDDNSLFLLAGDFVGIIDNKTFKVQADYTHLFKELPDYFVMGASLALNPKKREIALGVLIDYLERQEQIFIFNLEDLSIKQVTSDLNNRWGYLDYSSDGKYLAVGLATDGGKINLYDGNTYNILDTFELGGQIRDMKFTPDNKSIYAGGNFEIRDCNIKSGKFKTITKNLYGILSFEFINNDEIIIGDNYERTISRYNIKTSEYTRLLPLRTYMINNVRLTKDKKYIFGTWGLYMAYAKLDLISSVKEGKKELLFPNPGTDWINLPKTNKKDISLTDSKGKIIKVKIEKHRINISELLRGAYFLNINSKSYKLIKE